MTESKNMVEINMKILAKEVLLVSSCDKSKALKDLSGTCCNFKPIGGKSWVLKCYKGRRKCFYECIGFQKLRCFMIIWFEANYLFELCSYNFQSWLDLTITEI